MLPVFAPSAAGLNVTLIEQLNPAPNEAPQALVCAKSVVEEAMLPMVSAPVPVFFSVKVCAALVVLICRLPNAKVVGVSETPGAEGVTDAAI